MKLIQLSIVVVCLCCEFYYGNAAAEHDHEHGKDAYDLFLKEFNRTGPFLHVTDVRNAISGIFSSITCGTTCSECLNNVTDFVGADVNTGVNETQFHDITNIVLYYIHDASKLCASSPLPSKNVSIVNELKSLYGHSQNVFTDHHLEHILEGIKRVYTPMEDDHDHDHDHDHDEDSKCFTAHSLFHDLELANDEADDHEMGAVTSLVIHYLFEGYSIGPCVKTQDARAKQFKESLYHLLGVDEHSSSISEEEFEKLLEKLNIGGKTSTVTPSTDEDHSGHDHKRSVDTDTHGHNDSEFEAVNKCFSAEDILTIYGVNHSAGVSYEQFMTMCPSLLQQQVGNYCVAENSPSNMTCEKLSITEICGWATLSVLLISLCALTGILVIPCLNSGLFEYFMAVFMALAVGTMSADALLHLLPEALGVHGHAHDESCGAKASELKLSVEPFIWKQLAVLAAIEAFFLLETLMGIWHNRINPTNDEGHGHSHSPSVMLKQMQGTADVEETDVSSIGSKQTEKQHNNSSLTLSEDGYGSKQALTKSKAAKGFPILAVMIIIGDGIHNFADGVAIGAAFTQDAQTGIATSIAVFCHELPHEFGDFAILLSTGIGYKKALLLNFVSAITAFGGVFVGVFASVDETVRQWIFAVTAGMFLYIALADMLPELVRTSAKSNWKVFVFQQIGLLVGVFIMVLLGVFEEHIAV